MKKLFFAFLLVANFAHGQIYQNALLLGRKENGMIVLKHFAVPNDTLPPLVAYNDYPYLAAVNGVLYMYDWIAHHYNPIAGTGGGGGGGGLYTANNGLQLVGSVFGLGGSALSSNVSIPTYPYSFHIGDLSPHGVNSYIGGFYLDTTGHAFADQNQYAVVGFFNTLDYTNDSTLTAFNLLATHIRSGHGSSIQGRADGNILITTNGGYLQLSSYGGLTKLGSGATSMLGLDASKNIVEMPLPTGSSSTTWTSTQTIDGGGYNYNVSNINQWSVYGINQYLFSANTINFMAAIRAQFTSPYVALGKPYLQTSSAGQINDLNMLGSIGVVYQPSGDITLTGILHDTGSTAQQGTIRYIFNSGTTNNVILKNENAGSTAWDRFALGGHDWIIHPGEGVFLVHDGLGTPLGGSSFLDEVGSYSRWRVMGTRDQVPQLTTVQRVAISNQYEGQHVYDITTHKEYVWDGSAWQALW